MEKEETKFLGSVEAIRLRTVSGRPREIRSPKPFAVRTQINEEGASITAADRARTNLEPNDAAPVNGGFEETIPESYPSIRSVNLVAMDRSWMSPAKPSLICERANRLLPPEWKSAHADRLPSFFILGAAKCGTTSLHGYFGQHPEICMSEPKEPHYFESEYEKGATYYFNRYFYHWSGEAIVGEARHRNLYFPYTAARIYHYNPAAKLIVCLRNPAERAVSHWWHWFSRGEEPLSLRRSLEADWERVRSGVGAPTDPAAFGEHARTLFPSPRGFVRTYLDSGHYYEQLLRYLTLFGREKLRIILFEDLAAVPARVMAGLFEFVGADPRYAVECDYTPLNRSKSGMPAQVDPELVAWLVEYFRPHNRLLSRLIGRNLNHWNNPFQGSAAV